MTKGSKKFCTCHHSMVDHQLSFGKGASLGSCSVPGCVCREYWSGDRPTPLAKKKMLMIRLRGVERENIRTDLDVHESLDRTLKTKGVKPYKFNTYAR